MFGKSYGVKRVKAGRRGMCCVRKSCSLPIICLFLLMAKVYYFVVLLLQYCDNQ